MSKAEKWELEKLRNKQLRLKSSELLLKKNLPHRNLFKHYKWSRKFYESRNPVNLLCAANQISKSSTQMRKCIEWATNQSLWPKLWKTKPNQFWYLYPSADVATAEFELKWMQFMPAGELKDHPVYGWKAEYDKKKIKIVRFNSGVVLFFKTYAQDVMRLQSGTVYAMFTDEELPEELLNELILRLAAVNGYFHMVFTATLNQDFWRRAIQPGNRDNEVLPNALKIQVSMYDCLEYEDGDTNTPWTPEKINKVKESCSTKAAVQKRVYGKFESEEGRIYSAFDPGKHLIKPRVIPVNWNYYSGTDIGSGGVNHPPAIVFVAVNPTYTLGYVCISWRGDDGKEYTAGDVFNKTLELRGDIRPISQRYDWASKDFGTIAAASGESFEKAEKSHEIGENIVNTLFKNDMLFVFDDEDGEGAKLSGELYSLMRTGLKNKKRDDLADANRYCNATIPWDFESVKLLIEAPKKKERYEGLTPEQAHFAREIDERRGMFDDGTNSKQDGASWRELDEEIHYWNDQYD